MAATVPASRSGLTEASLWPALRRYWHPVAVADKVGEQPVPVTLLDEKLVVVRLGDRIAVFQDLCIHRGTPLSLGWVDGCELVCAYHGWSYAADGRCTRIPALPADRTPPARARVKAYDAAERYGLVWTCLEKEPAAPIPDFPEFDDPEWNRVRYLIGPLAWSASGARAIENFVDQSHFAWVHEGILGDRRYPEYSPVEIDRVDEALVFRWNDRAPNVIHPVEMERRYVLSRPFTIHQIQQRLGREEAECFFFTVTPHTARTHTNYLWVLANFDMDDAERAEHKRIGELIMEQDRHIVERQRPEELPVDLSAELHIKGPDAVAVEYRRFMAELDVDVDSR